MNYQQLIKKKTPSNLLCTQRKGLDRDTISEKIQRPSKGYEKVFYLISNQRNAN
jgi:hypothetical protein